MRDKCVEMSDNTNKMRDRLIELFKKIEKEPAITCPAYKTDKTCKDCKYSINDSLCNHIERQVDYLLANGGIVPPCKVGDKVYFNKAEIEETCPAKVIKICHNFFTPSMPLWITIQYESKLIGRQEVEMTSDVFELLCFPTKEEAERALKG